MKKHETHDERFDRIELQFEKQTDSPIHPMDERFWGKHLDSTRATPHTRFCLAKMLFTAVQEKKNDRIDKIIKCRNFNFEVVAKLVEWSGADEKSRAQTLENELVSANSFVNRFKEGLKNRADQVDKRTGVCQPTCRVTSSCLL